MSVTQKKMFFKTPLVSVAFVAILSLGIAGALPTPVQAVCDVNHTSSTCVCTFTPGYTETNAGHWTCVDHGAGTQTIQNAATGQTVTGAASEQQMSQQTTNTSNTQTHQPAPMTDNGPLNTTFKPLTQIPAITELGGTPTLAPFLNTLYKLCIGVAAILAVLQIMRAGIMYMSPDSVSEKTEARNLIGWSLFGLLLVLTPTIVFGIIDPRILKLDIDSSIRQIAPSTSSSSSNNGGNGGTGASNNGDGTGNGDSTTGSDTATGGPQTDPDNTTPGGGTPGPDVTPPAQPPGGSSGTAQVAVTQGAYVYVSYVAASYANVPHCSFVEAHDQYESQSTCAAGANGTHSPYHVVTSPAPCTRATGTRITITDIPAPICPSDGVYPQ